MARNRSEVLRVCSAACDYADAATRWFDDPSDIDCMYSAWLSMPEPIRVELQSNVCGAVEILEFRKAAVGYIRTTFKRDDAA